MISNLGQQPIPPPLLSQGLDSKVYTPNHARYKRNNYSPWNIFLKQRHNKKLPLVVGFTHPSNRI